MSWTLKRDNLRFPSSEVSALVAVSGSSSAGGVSVAAAGLVAGGARPAEATRALVVGGAAAASVDALEGARPSTLAASVAHEALRTRALVGAGRVAASGRRVALVQTQSALVHVRTLAERPRRVPCARS